MGVKYQIKRFLFRIKWRKLNQHNKTEPVGIFNPKNVRVGNFTYGLLCVLAYNQTNKLVIGNFCSIASGVQFLVCADHAVDNISTFPFKVMALHSCKEEAISKGDIIVDDDVWIGQNAVILSGVHIGQGAVVAARAVVSKDVPPYAIVGGVPAKVIRYRFSQDMIDELMKVDYSKLDVDLVKEHEDDLYTELTDVGQLDWLPKKE